MVDEIPEPKRRSDAGRVIVRVVPDDHLHIRLNSADPIEGPVLKAIDNEVTALKQTNPKATRRHAIVALIGRHLESIEKDKPDETNRPG